MPITALYAGRNFPSRPAAQHGQNQRGAIPGTTRRMPFESSLPLVIACGLFGFMAICLWTQSRAYPALVVGALLILAGLGVFIADRLVVTDRESIEELFPRLARAAEERDMPTIMASLDPEFHAFRKEAEEVLQRVRPTKILITFLEVAVDPAQSPSKATADVVVRVAGDGIEAGMPGDLLAELRVLLQKKDGRWLIQDAEADGARLGPASKKTNLTWP